MLSHAMHSVYRHLEAIQKAGHTKKNRKKFSIVLCGLGMWLLFIISYIAIEYSYMCSYNHCNVYVYRIIESL